MTDIQVFNNTEFGELEVLEEEGKCLFPATKCATILGYSNPQEAIRTHCKGVREILTPSNGGSQTTRYITEGDLYRLITRSRLPKAQEFEQWVFDEVLPSIRKHGMYAVDDLLNDPDLLIAAATKLKEERSARQLAERQVADLAHQLDESKEYYTVKRVAKLNGIRWNKIQWRKLKNTSDYMGYEYPKIFDANYGEVNTYHINVWKQEYPELRY